jgi:predicted enzyme related to lactoylglutathione lyase
MTDPNFVVLYVENPPASVEFYSMLLAKQPVEASPKFAMFALQSGVMLGLWSRPDVEPAVARSGNGSELDFALADDAAVDAAHAEWIRRGVKIVQNPVRMDFGYTFTGVDPDGHRLRVFAPAAA